MGLFRRLGLVALAMGIISFAGCGGNVAVSTCVPGESASCIAASGCAGAQVCRSDGTYDACVCFDAGPTDAANDDANEGGSWSDAGSCLIPAEVASRWLAFDSDRGSFNRDIYLVRGDGSGLKRLTTETSTEIDPAFSHDGAWLLFASDRSGSMQIHKMDLVQGNVTQLTSLTAGADEPSWSADDKSIVFHSGPSVYVMGADGSNPQVLGTGIDDFNAYKYPSLSLDGTEVMFDRNNEIDARKVDQSGQRYVVQNWTTTEETPALSPDGLIAAYGVFCDAVEQIASTPFAGYAADPCKTQRVTPVSAGAARRPAWGSSQFMAFERSASSSADINPAVISVSLSPGSVPCDIVGAPGDNRDPNWAPPGFSPN
jgi:hypothetical protein